MGCPRLCNEWPAGVTHPLAMTAILPACPTMSTHWRTPRSRAASRRPAPRIDSVAESELYRRLAPRVRLYGLRHLRDPHAAHDLVQQVLLMTLERLRAGKLREPERIASFVLGMCRMVVLEIRRGTWRRQTLLETYGDTPEAVEVPEPLALDADRLAGCLQALAERERTVVVLTFFADKSSDEVAKDAGAFGRQRARHPPPRAGAAARVHGGGGVMTRARCAAPIELERARRLLGGRAAGGGGSARSRSTSSAARTARGGSSSSPPWRPAYASRCAAARCKPSSRPRPRAHEAAGHAHPRVPAGAGRAAWPARSARTTTRWSAACRRRSRA